MRYLVGVAEALVVAAGANTNGGGLDGVAKDLAVASLLDLVAHALDRINFGGR